MADDPDKKVRIEIRNWEKYQRPLKGKEGSAASRRSWVAMSVDMDSDPDYLELPLLERHVWACLLRHAGKVGPVFDLCASRARRMFDLPRTPKLSLLADQGFIEIGNATNKTNKTNKTRQTEQNKTRAKRAVAKAEKPDFASVQNLTPRWAEWDEFRKTIGGRPYKTTRAAEDLAKYPSAVQDAAIDEAMTKEWKSLHPRPERSNDGLNDPMRKTMQNLRELSSELN